MVDDLCVNMRVCMHVDYPHIFSFHMAFYYRKTFEIILTSVEYQLQGIIMSYRIMIGMKSCCIMKLKEVNVNQGLHYNEK